MGKLLARVAITFGLLTLFHSGYSAYQLRALHPDHPPLDVVLETLFSLIVFSLGVTASVEPLKEIGWQAVMRTWTVEQASLRPGFTNYRHRGTLLFSDANSDTKAVKAMS